MTTPAQDQAALRLAVQVACRGGRVTLRWDGVALEAPELRRWHGAH